MNPEQVFVMTSVRNKQTALRIPLIGRRRGRVEAGVTLLHLSEDLLQHGKRHDKLTLCCYLYKAGLKSRGMSTNTHTYVYE